MTKKILLVLAFAALWAPRAHASVVIASASVSGVPLTGVNPNNAKIGTIIKGLRLCNDTTVATCVNVQDANSVKQAVLCAGAQACADTPHDAAASPNGSASQGGLQNFAGELMVSTMTYTVFGSTPSASIYVEAWYSQPFK